MSNEGEEREMIVNVAGFVFSNETKIHITCRCPFLLTSGLVICDSKMSVM